MLEKLLTTPNEQNEKIEYLRELLIREKSNSELIKKLKDEQSIALADKDKEVILNLKKIGQCFFINFFSKKGSNKKRSNPKA